MHINHINNKTNVNTYTCVQLCIISMILDKFVQLLSSW